jgi:hypothetical protein
VQLFAEVSGPVLRLSSSYGTSEKRYSATGFKGFRSLTVANMIYHHAAILLKCDPSRLNSTPMPPPPQEALFEQDRLAIAVQNYKQKNFK